MLPIPLLVLAGHVPRAVGLRLDSWALGLRVRLVGIHAFQHQGEDVDHRVELGDDR